MISGYFVKLCPGQTIKGYDQGMKTMKKGENATSTIPPKMAYEESGSPPKIPPNATLQFDLRYFHGPLSKIIAKMVAYLRRYLRMDRNGRTQRILMKYLVSFALLGHFSQRSCIFYLSCSE